MPRLKNIRKERNGKYEKLVQEDCEDGERPATNEEDFLFGTEDNAENRSVVERRNRTIRRVRARSCCSRQACVRFTCTCYAFCACLFFVSLGVMAAPFVIQVIREGPYVDVGQQGGAVSTVRQSSAPAKSTMPSSTVTTTTTETNGTRMMNSTTVFPSPTSSSPHLPVANTTNFVSTSAVTTTTTETNGTGMMNSTTVFPSPTSSSPHLPVANTTEFVRPSTVFPTPNATATVHTSVPVSNGTSQIGMNSTVPIPSVTSSLPFPFENTSMNWFNSSKPTPLPSPTSGHAGNSTVTVNVTTASVSNGTAHTATISTIVPTSAPATETNGTGMMNSTAVSPSPTSSLPHSPVANTTNFVSTSTIFPTPNATSTVRTSVPVSNGTAHMSMNSTVPIPSVTSSLPFPFENTSMNWFNSSKPTPLPSPTSDHMGASTVTVNMTTAQPQNTTIQPIVHTFSTYIQPTASTTGGAMSSLSEQMPTLQPSQPTQTAFLTASSSSTLWPELTASSPALSSLPVETGSVRPSSPPPASPTPQPTPGPVRCADELEVCAPLSDTSLYRVLTLSNSLRVLLVSNSQTSTAAAAVDVSSGSFNDGDVPGLAHFCEHILFLGTAKYPEEGEYSKYLSTNGGYDNAYTSAENTNYYLSVNSEKLEGAMDRLAQFFVSPLFGESGVEREKNAVNSEYQKDKGVPGWIDYQMTKIVADPASPYSRFSIGSLETFNRSDLVDRLHRYYTSTYSANLMQLAVYGKEDLDTLQNWAETYFTDIPNRNLRTPFPQSVPYPDFFSPRIVSYKPLGSTPSLTWVWQSPSLQSQPRLRLPALLKTLFTFTGSGSLLDHLQGQGWASSVDFSTDNYADFSLHSLGVELTQAGQTNSTDVVSAVFAYLSFLRSSSEQDLEEVWTALRDLKQIEFDYPDPPSDVPRYASGLASMMRTTEDPVDFLSPPQRFSWSYKPLSDLLGKFTPENANIFFANPSVSLNKTLAPESHQGLCSGSVPPINGLEVSYVDLVEPFFSTPYGVYCVPSSTVEQWKSLQPLSSARLPRVEMFLPVDLSLHSLPSPFSGTPELVHSSQGHSVWWMPDAQFRIPFQIIKCQAKTGIPGSSPYHRALSSVYKNYFALVLSEVEYYASLAGYTLTFDLSYEGLYLEFQGFSDHSVMTTFIQSVLNTTLSQVSHSSLSAAEDKVGLALLQSLQYSRDYNSSHLPYQYVRDFVLTVLEEPRFYYKDILNELEKMTVSQQDLVTNLADFMGSVLSSISDLTCYATGNVVKEQAISCSALVHAVLSSNAPDSEAELVKVIKVPRGVTAFTVPTLNPDKDENSAIFVADQVGLLCDPVEPAPASSGGGAVSCSQDSINNTVYSSLLHLMIKDACFDQLRTKEQLGYAVACGSFAVDSSVSVVYFLVQSAVQPPSYLLNRTWEFVRTFRRTIKSSDAFNQAVQAYRSILQAKDKTLSNQADRIWTEIITKQFRFDKNQELLQVVDSMTLEELVMFYHHSVVDPSYSGENHQSVRELVVGAFQNVSALHFDQITSERQFTLAQLSAFKANATEYW